MTSIEFYGPFVVIALSVLHFCLSPFFWPYEIPEILFNHFISSFTFHRDCNCLLSAHDFVSYCVKYFYAIPKFELKLIILLFNSVRLLYTVGK
jgi:hypothetical protein